MIHRLFSQPPVVAVALAFLACTARGEDTVSSIKFSDPSRPGTVRINLGRGELRIQGTDTGEVTVKSEARPQSSTRRKDGLREISSASGFALTEKDNVVTLDAAVSDWGKRSSDFKLTVPRNSSVIVQNAWGGDITCAGVAGDLEINCMHGEIELEDVAGGVVVSTMNGEITASIRELREGKPLSFTSMNGEVQLRLPDNAKANVRLRTQNGSVLTDFDETVLVTKAEAIAGPGRRSISFSGSKVLTVEIQEAIREATAASATAVREALEAVKVGLEEARLNSDEARREVAEARRQIERVRREEERARRDVTRSQSEAAPEPKPAPPAPAAPAATPRAPVPPKVSVPTLSGGKLVTGTLNGGGPEISVTTMNGDVILRKLSSQ